jgi:NADH dehydrogenase
MTGLVAIFGGSGFIGRYVVRAIAARGWRVRVVVRDIRRAAYLKTTGDLAQVSLVPGTVSDPGSVAAAVAGADVVVNLVGILSERGRRTFHALHVEAARTIAAAARSAGVPRLIHVSALGADRDSVSAYARSKAEGEDAVRAAFPGATIMRPSVVFGPEDGFFNRFGQMAQVSPVLPYFTDIVPHAEGGGGAKFQPVYVGDVAEAITQAAISNGHAGVTYELAGPRVYDMRQILDLVNRETMRRRMVKGFPYPLADALAAALQAVYWARDVALGWLIPVALMPDPMLTRDQVKLLKQGSVATGRKPGLSAFGIEPTSADVIAPSYLKRFRPVQQNKRLRLAPRA